MPAYERQKIVLSVNHLDPELGIVFYSCWSSKPHVKSIFKCTNALIFKCESGRDGSVVKGTCCSCRGPGLCSQHPHGGSELSVTLGLGDWVLCFGLCMYLVHSYMCRQMVIGIN